LQRRFDTETLRHGGENSHLPQNDEGFFHSGASVLLYASVSLCLILHKLQRARGVKILSLFSPRTRGEARGSAKTKRDTTQEVGLCTDVVRQDKINGIIN